MGGISRLQRGPFCSQDQALWPWDSPVESGSRWIQTSSFHYLSQDTFFTMDQCVIHKPRWCQVLLGRANSCARERGESSRAVTVSYRLLGSGISGNCHEKPMSLARWSVAALASTGRYKDGCFGARCHSLKPSLERNQVGQTGHCAPSLEVL